MNDPMDGLLQKAKWSDAFFHYVPAEQAFANDGCPPVGEYIDLMEDAARQFRDAHPDCPYSVSWLVCDFIKRA